MYYPDNPYDLAHSSTACQPMRPRYAPEIQKKYLAGVNCFTFNKWHILVFAQPYLQDLKRVLNIINAFETFKTYFEYYKRGLNKTRC